MTWRPRSCAMRIARATAARFSSKGASNVGSTPAPERSFTRPKGVIAIHVAPHDAHSSSERP